MSGNDTTTRQQTAYVYIFQRGDLSKIGWSKNPLARMRTFATRRRPCIMINAFPCQDPQEIESALHAAFDAKRVKGEWFSLNPDDLALIRSIKKVDAVEDLPSEIRPKDGDERIRRQCGQSADGSLFRLPDGIHKAMKALADENNRPMTWEIKLALIAHLTAAGRWPVIPD